MYPFGKHPFYCHTEEDRKLVLDSMGITETQLKEDVESLMEWFKKQPHLAEAGLNTQMARMYIIMAKGSVEKAKQKLDFLYKARLSVPEIVNRVAVFRRDRPVWDHFVMFPVRKLYKGSRITFLKVYDWSKFSVEEIVIRSGMLFDIRWYTDFFANDIWVLDFSNASLSQLMSLNYVAMGKSYLLMRKGVGLRVAAMHLIRPASVTNIAQFTLNIVKSFMSQKMMKTIIFHDSSDSLKDYFPPQYLPKDYGGELDSIDVHKEKMEEMIQDSKQFLLDALKVASDESKRPKAEYNEECLQGNFRKLEFD